MGSEKKACGLWLESGFKPSRTCCVVLGTLLTLNLLPHLQNGGGTASLASTVPGMWQVQKYLSMPACSPPLPYHLHYWPLSFSPGIPNLNSPLGVWGKTGKYGAHGSPIPLSVTDIANQLRHSFSLSPRNPS